MTSANFQAAPPKRLRTDPSVPFWSAELRDLLDGKRAAFIEHLANAADYTEDQVKRSSRPSKSRGYLVAALDAIVREWNASPHDDPDFQDILFDLLRRYTPPNGFPKLVRFLELKNIHPALSRQRQRALTLQRKALHAMENYFPAAPTWPEGSSTVNDAAFLKYVNVLTNLLSRAEHAAYAMRTLFKIGVLPLDGEQIVRMLSDYPSAIRGILQYLVEPEHGDQATTDLPDLYNICLSIGSGAEENFRVELEALGGRFRDAIGGPYVVLPRSSQEVFLQIQGEHCLQYAELSDRRTKVRPNTRLRQLLRSVHQSIGA